MANWRAVLSAGCRGIERWSAWWATFAGILTLALALLTVVLVVARYAFAWTLNGWDELRWHLFGAIFLIAMAGCLAAGGHVRVDVLQQRLSPRVRAGIDLALTLLVLVPFCAVMLWYGSRSAHNAWSLPRSREADHWSRQWSAGDTESKIYRIVAPVEAAARATVLRGERSPNEGGLEARWLVKALIPLGFLLLGVQGLAHAGRQILILLPEPVALESVDEAVS